jgi:hypothetical protein
MEKDGDMPQSPLLNGGNFVWSHTDKSKNRDGFRGQRPDEGAKAFAWKRTSKRHVRTFDAAAGDI